VDPGSVDTTSARLQATVTALAVLSFILLSPVASRLCLMAKGVIPYPSKRNRGGAVTRKLRSMAPPESRGYEIGVSYCSIVGKGDPIQPTNYRSRQSLMEKRATGQAFP
jgi:hypothetical protein